MSQDVTSQDVKKDAGASPAATARVEQLSAKKREVLRAMLLEKRRRQAREGRIPRRVPADHHPLSFAQHRLWFLWELMPSSPYYNMPRAYLFSGDLRPAALEAAFAALVARHESLRTTFDVVDEEPVQKIAPELRLPLPVVDLAALPEKRRRAVAEKLGTELVRQPFDLRRLPLMRLLLARLGEREHVLFLSIHHIVSDGWSMMVLNQEIEALYGAALGEGFSPLAPLQIQYADFAVWQRGWLSEEMLAAQLAYWKRRLAGVADLLELPTDRPRPPVQDLSGAHLPIPVPPRLEAALRALGEGQGVLLYSILVAAFKAVLWRYTGRTDLLLGSPIANRNKGEIEGLIGFFVNMLLLRNDLSGDPSFLEVIRRVQKATLEGYDNQDLPFERLVEELRPERHLSYTPVFQVMFNLLNFPYKKAGLEDLEIEPWRTGTATSKYDLSLYFYDDGQKIEGFLEYATALFDAATVARLRAHLLRVLETVAVDPETRLSALPLLGAAEHHLLTVERNEAPFEAGPPWRLDELLTARAARCPDAPAVSAGEVEWTYGELAARAHRLARHLRRLGVGPETLVALFVERSAEMVAALWAVLEAGGAYVPIDPAYPAERVAYMLDDARPAVVLTDARSAHGAAGTLPAFAATSGAVVLEIDEDPAAGESSDPLPGAHAAGHLAYVIYTSGSTGKPKGVMVPHRPLVNFLRSMARRPGLTSADVLLSVTTLSFDIAGLEIYLPLLAGARLVIAAAEESADPSLLAARLEKSGATMMQATPATWRLLVDIGARLPADLRVLAGGETLPQALAMSLLERGREVWNLYGPTETTVWSSVQRVPRHGAVTLGRPIHGTALHVLDRDGRPAPLGIPGELLIGGAGLTRGYLRRPGLTAERFVPDALGDEPGARAYRTGDLARHRARGEVEFLGRIDHQVKVRGFRIELGEIEAALERHAAVRSAVAVAVRSEAGGDRLAAWLLLEEGAEAGRAAPPVEEWREFLGRFLPDYMVPGQYIVRDAYPLTPSGKVDRGALAKEAARGGSRPGLASRFEEPEGELEEHLAGAWKKILGVERIGRHDRFFDLGGTSIQAAIFTNLVQQELGEIVHVPALFRAQTIAEFRAFLERDYADALARRFGGAASTARPALTTPNAGIDAFDVLDLRRRAADARTHRRAGRAATGSQKRLPRAVFVLSPPRAGSTLLRVMLAGHPRLFSPPELELLAYDTLGERDADLSGAASFAKEGLLRTVMELWGLDAAAAQAKVEEYEAADLPTAELYGLLQERCAGRLLVDKTTTYALEPETLARAEEIFEAPLYIHLLRHPCATVKSYVDVRLDQFLRFENPYDARAQAELLWTIDHQNIVRFLDGVPAERQFQLRFEDLLATPERMSAALCDFLGLEMHPAMLSPYEGRRMTDGVHAASRMHGDPRFHEHRGIDAAVAEKWRAEYAVADLAPITRRLMVDFGYDDESGREFAPGDDSRRLLEAPLSPAQERMWLLHRIEPESPAYHIPIALRLDGRLDRGALERALGAVIRRHDALRTSFHDADERLLQRVAVEEERLALPLADLAGLPASRRPAALKDLWARLLARPFELSRPPLWRFVLARLGDGSHTLLAILHHAVADGWSLGVLMRDTVAFYEAERLAAPSPLAPLTLQYPAHALAERRAVGGVEEERQLAWWRERLAGIAPLALPTNRARPERPSGRGHAVQRLLGAARGARLRNLARQYGTSLFNVLSAAGAALLGRLAGQDDVTLGAPVANRPRRELEEMIGLFVNTVVLRADLGGDPSFGELVERQSAFLLGALEHQGLPFERLVEALEPERDPSRPPLFQVLFNFLNFPLEKHRLSGLEVRPLELESRAAQFDLSLFWAERGDELLLRVEYRPELFERTTIERLAARYEELLAAAAARPASRLAELLRPVAEERRQIFGEWVEAVLPARAGASGEGETAWEAPRGALEERLAALWEELLGRPGVGRHDDFFALGGQSLLATRLASRLRRDWGLELDVRLLFEHSTLAALAAVIARQESAAPSAPPLAPRPPGEDAPLSFAQERLWFLDQLEPGAVAYNMPAAVRLVGRLERAALEAALDALVARHETLRTRFATVEKRPVQRVATPAPRRWPEVDLSALEAARRQALVSRLADGEALRPFDLARGPLLRAVLLRLGEDDHVLLLTLHHVIADGWSLGILVRELGELYGAAVARAVAPAAPAAFSAGARRVTSPLAPLPLQYADWAAWQRAWLSEAVLESQLAWWREQLAEARGVLELPTDRPRPALMTYRGAVHARRLPPALYDKARFFSQLSGTTLYMTLLAAFGAKAARLSGERDLLLGMPVAGRDRSEVEGLIGFFVNTLVARLDLRGESGGESDGASFATLVQRAREAALGALAHQAVPFEKLVEELRPRRDRSRSPLVQVLVQLHNAPETRLELPELRFEAVEKEAQAAKFELVLNLTETDGELHGAWRYNRDLFDATTIERMARQFETLLEAALADPEQAVEALPLLGDAAAHQLTVEWNAPARLSADGPEGETLAEIFALQAARRGDAVALAQGERTSTWNALAARVGVLAARLRARGVGPETRVAVFCERSLELVPAILAVLEAGGAYVPLDAATPAARLRFILEDSGARLILVEAALRERLGTLATSGDVEVVVLEEEEAPPEPLPAARPALPENVAYVIYTSGSTGRPKGVEVTHRNAVRLLRAAAEIYDFGPDDVWTLFHSPAFDFSVWEIWGALAWGGRLEVVPYATSRSPEAFRALLAERRVTVLNQTPSAFYELIRADAAALEAAPAAAPEAALALRYVVFGGEALDASRLGDWLDRRGESAGGPRLVPRLAPRLVNMYGITETTVHVTWRFMTKADVRRRGPSPVGRPLGDLTVHLLDRHGRPVPIGVAGEIHVGGAGVARGYLRRPGLTAERFVPGVRASRLYKSGDLARFRADGELEYLGRIDHQVKIRGFRIELGEIEAAILEHAAVGEAAVLVRPHPQSGESALVAYLVPAATADADTADAAADLPKIDELRRFLAVSLPEHMAPSFAVELERLPLTENGKLDRRALPDPEAGPELAARFVAPRNPVEQYVAERWQEFLGVPKVGAEDDFFDLGGSSITGANLVNQLQEELGEIIQVVTLFDSPTVEGLADYLVREHPRAVARRFGDAVLAELAPDTAPATSKKPVDEARVAELRALVPPRVRRSFAARNPPAVFVLAPPRSGTTLLRVMLAGHPGLFAPPELELLSFDTLEERDEAFAGRDSFWLEGLVRAVMECRGAAAEEARREIDAARDAGLETHAFYRRLQEWIVPRRLVDKTPSYALDAATLQRAEDGFEDAVYLHLVRHPGGMIRSFEEAKLDQLFFRVEHSFSRRELAELLWVVSHRNILDFLAGVPGARQLRVSFEELVREPRRVTEEICVTLGVELHEAMLDPYAADGRERMTGGPHAESRMLGDVKFLHHRGIDPAVAERWREELDPAFLGEPTRALAAELGYEIEEASAAETAGTSAADVDEEMLAALIGEVQDLSPEELAAALAAEDEGER